MRRVLAACEARAIAAGVPVQVLKGIGDPASCILREIQRCDVVILRRETHFHFETQDQPDTTLGEGVVVAYGGGWEVARTLQTFKFGGNPAARAASFMSSAASL